ncbi:relaxase/mobilization nuclease domain-containing protein [Brevundimonas denitrificans]|uniref:relaxase/mobilization nuclease domain-containing protein n=1 Tax=Brevundimonas denitrificans TaxID=1443434 RepID=UPI00223C1165|nr:hypothetical protein [Brevundimonas denitrificans]
MRLHDAARAFATEAFGERFPYVFALHDEGGHPHVHLTVRGPGVGRRASQSAQGRSGGLARRFAKALRDRGVEAEASPRRARGVTRKAERTPVRKMRERFAAGPGPAPRVMVSAWRQASSNPGRATPWEAAIRERQTRIRRALAAEAVALSHSERAEDRALGAALMDHLRRLPKVATREEQLSRLSDRSRDAPGRRR